MVPAESLLVASRADDGRLAGLLEQVDCVLLSLLGSVVVKSLHSWGAMVEVGGQHCFSSVGQEEEHEPLEDRWNLCNPLPDVLVDLVKDAWLKSLEDHAIGPLDLTVSTWVFDRGLVDPDTVSITEV